MQPPSTAYARAVLALLERIAVTLPVMAEPIEAVLVGGTAVHFHTVVRVSQDVEAIFSHRVLMPPDLVLRWTDEAGDERTLVYDPGYFRDRGLVHPDYDRDAIDCESLLAERLRVRVLSPVDLAVSKLGRWVARDRDDVESLARHGLLDPESLRARAEEALDYFVGDPRWVKLNLEEARVIIEVANQHRGVEP